MTPQDSGPVVPVALLAVLIVAAFFGLVLVAVS